MSNLYLNIQIKKIRNWFAFLIHEKVFRFFQFEKFFLSDYLKFLKKTMFQHLFLILWFDEQIVFMQFRNLRFFYSNALIRSKMLREMILTSQS
jgi:hypothetical protein